MRDGKSPGQSGRLMHRMGYARTTGTIFRKRGIVLRISEAYEHEPILAYQPGESCPSGSCSRVGTQCVNIAAPMVLTPSAVMGAATVTCQGTPVITCVTQDGGATCTVTMTQQVCVSVPIRYGVTMTTGDVTIGCADSCVGSGCC